MNTNTIEAAPDVSPAIVPRNYVTQPAASIVHFENILVPLDFSAMSLRSLRYAVCLAGQFGAKLTLLHVLPPPVIVPDFPYPGPGGQDGFDAIETLLLKIRTAEIPCEVQVETIVRRCFIFDGIIEVAREIHADLIIVTTQGETGLKHLLLGSTAESIVRLAPCPVLVVR